MNIDEIKKIISDDSQFVDMIAELKDSGLSHDDYKQKAHIVNDYLFKKFCLKGYLDSCEPEYCTYRFTEQCPYLLALSYISDEMGIELIV